jgi:hypothetical protein
MIIIEIFFQRPKIDLFLIILFFCLNYYIYCINELDYYKKKRLNNGNYFILSTQGLYLYNEDFNAKVGLVVFNSSQFTSHADITSSDIAQFSKDDNGYIICLVKDELYVLSKSGTYLNHITVDFVIREFTYRIVPYGKNNNEYYFAIFFPNDIDQIIIIKKYKYNSATNSINLDDTKNYTPYIIDLKKGISCELMNYYEDQVIACFYGGYEKPVCTVFDTIDFEVIPNLGGIINTQNAKGGQFFISRIDTSNREKGVFCAQQIGNLVCYGFNISNNYTFTDAVEVENTQCKIEVEEMEVEFFPETNEFLFGCRDSSNNLYLGKFSSDFTYTHYDPIVLDIP